ncbi:hypothetical protein [Ammoniphilus sp. 3BR4]|uniref:hypothetical protein n=1 Tax=Ammoniphilus sp. 3BR4 TaxID=3158265 RepID=UPI0034658FAB
MNRGKIWGYFIILLFGFVPLSLMFGLPNYMRYEAEKTFSEPHSFFYGTGIGIQKTQEPQNYYDKEYEMDDLEEIRLDLSNSEDITLYGKVSNSADPLIVILNNEVIYNGDMSNSDIPNVWDEFYLDKYFAIDIDKVKEKSVNQITMTSGNATKTIKVYVE